MHFSLMTACLRSLDCELILWKEIGIGLWFVVDLVRVLGEGGMVGAQTGSEFFSHTFSIFGGF